MSENEYQEECCESCLYFGGHGFLCFHSTVEVNRYGRPCEHFTPSLQCRQVRALERLSQLLDVVGPHGGLLVDAIVRQDQ